MRSQRKTNQQEHRCKGTTTTKQVPQLWEITKSWSIHLHPSCGFASSILLADYTSSVWLKSHYRLSYICSLNVFYLYESSLMTFGGGKQVHRAQGSCIANIWTWMVAIGWGLNCIVENARVDEKREYMLPES